MLPEKLNRYSLILASGSPRRQQFFKELGLDFKFSPRPVEENYPEQLKGPEISNYLARLKASAFYGELKPNEILITSDTIVWHNEKSLAKPAHTNEAVAMLKTLSGDWHKVITSVCFTTVTEQRTIAETTEVKFKRLTDEEIRFYVNTYEPFDKAGGYGIQDWIGLIGIEKIKGSYANVVGLPTHVVYKTLTDMVG
ncbi:Maf-like protein [Ulvibacterium sp.]|uniref:Maf-like protein n=1 Tax=Ulvibacterium sp. TaxID=2665914 RepID=UPI002625615F|nr:Maf-like protein [Ulvibacterium sp.]